MAEAIAQAAASEANLIVVPEHTRLKRVPRKARCEQLPDHLERYEVELSVPDAARSCPHHGAKKLIGYDRLETLWRKRGRSQPCSAHDLRQG